MNISLEKASETDAHAIYDMQVKAFKPLLEKYQDYETNPANEKIDRVLSRIHDPKGGFYKIIVEGTLVGAICARWKDNETTYWISPMFIMPEYQGRGIAQEVISLIELQIPQATTWELSTLLEEERNCYLYEKMGYVKTGVEKKINNRTTLIYFKKDL